MSLASDTIASQFEPLFAQLEHERELSDAIREKSKELDRLYRALSSLLNGVHSTHAADFPRIVERTLPLWEQVRSKVAELTALVPQDGFYRWCDEFSFPLKSLTSAIALIVLLSTGALVTKHQAAQVLGLAAVDEGRVQLATEDYLHALINAINDLPRLAVNCVTLGDYRTPVRLAAFVKQLHAAFQLLNLKNDALRKRFDSLKYDVKKIEEIVYDISLRGLVSGVDQGADGLAFPRGDQEQQKLVDQLTHSHAST
ncbi:related to Translin [Sporisorium reilianum f. sp. reilianum]|uniref:Related to Translin n=1 Tax=Sporisorium reilianum f. sp. reilianum TaxID=72559 RepID=A0A2N8UAC0_9BASI|nr:related to Translin [Sporisorium reilianum f. sp. reilianum]